jgi:DNA-binding Lrp family transcriptional regulator
MLTSNEKKVLRLLLSSIEKDYSINDIARMCNISPGGALKILNKFKNNNILKIKDIGDIKSYRINFNDVKTIPILELSIIDNLDKKLRYRLNDLDEMKKITSVAIVFGSYLKKNNPNDLDVLFLIKPQDFQKYKDKILKLVLPVKLHDVLQTEKDFKLNLKNDNIIHSILKEGFVLWGHDNLIKLIKNVLQRDKDVSIGNTCLFDLK